MRGRDIIVVGTSAGGVEALSRLAASLPPGLPAALFVVCHFPPRGTSILPEILSRSGPLPAHHARDGEAIVPGQICVAPPDYHLLLRPGAVQLSHGPHENRARPAIDLLFRTAARSYGRRVVGVILTGSLGDGAAGLLAVRMAGGVAVVQDPFDAVVGSMPRTALEVAGADHVLPLDQIAPLLVKLACETTSAAGVRPMPDPLDQVPQRVNHDMAAQEQGDRRGQLSVYTCPECGGALWQVDESALARFRCHVGHAYYGEALLEEQSEALEAALWTAVRTFKEKTVLARQLARQALDQGKPEVAARFDEDAALAERYGLLIEEYLLREGVPNSEPPAPAPRGANAAAGPAPARHGGATGGGKP
jgi:two-component system chemotaxis response regulator CheB